MATGKQCNKCGETKPRGEYYKAPRGKGGLRAACKKCDAIWRKKYREDHRAKIAEYNKKWHEINREAVIARHKEYHEANREKVATRKQKYREANREMDAVYYHRRRARLAAAAVEDFDEQEVWERDGRVCVYCGSTEDLTLDHIVPLSKGGAHSPDNLCIACRSCNSSKGAKRLIGWLAANDKLDVLTQGGLL